MDYMTQREEQLDKQVKKLVGMIETIIFKHPYTRAMFEEELRLAGAWPITKQTEENTNTQTHGNNERAAEDDKVRTAEG